MLPQERAVLHGFSINKTGSRPSATRCGQVLGLLFCSQPFRFSVQLLTRLVELDRDVKTRLGTGRSPMGCCARLLLQLLFLAVTMWLLGAPRARRSFLMLLSSPSQVGAMLPPTQLQHISDLP